MLERLWQLQLMHRTIKLACQKSNARFGMLKGHAPFGRGGMTEVWDMTEQRLTVVVVVV